MSPSAALMRILGDIIKERSRQDELYDWSDHTDHHKALAVSCEGMEVAQCILKGEPKENLRVELIQTAAIAIRWLQELEEG